VRGGPGRVGRIAAIEQGMASRYRHLLPDTAWVQVPYYDRKHTILLSETKIKGALQARAAGPKPRGKPARLQVRGRNGGWRSRGRVLVTVGPHGAVGVGTHWFRPEPEGEHVNLTAHGGVEPTYRMTREDYEALVKGVGHVEEAVR